MARRRATVDGAGASIGYPRVSATFDYKSPLFFEDELTIVARVHAVTQRTIKYSFVFTRGEAAIGIGWLTTACATRQEDGSMRSVEVPPGVVASLRVGGGPGLIPSAGLPNFLLERSTASGFTIYGLAPKAGRG